MVSHGHEDDVMNLRLFPTWSLWLKQLLYAARNNLTTAQDEVSRPNSTDATSSDIWTRFQDNFPSGHHQRHRRATVLSPDLYRCGTQHLVGLQQTPRHRLYQGPDGWVWVCSSTHHHGYPSNSVQHRTGWGLCEGSKRWEDTELLRVHWEHRTDGCGDQRKGVAGSLECNWLHLLLNWRSIHSVMIENKILKFSLSSI